VTGDPWQVTGKHSLRRHFILSLATCHFFMRTTFSLMREVHALCVKISRGSGRWQKQICGFIGISAENAVGIGSAKGFQQSD